MWSLDRRNQDPRHQRRWWSHSRRAETHYAIQLRKLAKLIEHMINGVAVDETPTMIEYMLMAYADIIEPWARATGARMLADVSRRDGAMWAQHSRTMSRALAEEIRTAPTGELLRGLLDEQVTLIKSLPLQAAQRVHEVALKGIENASRGEDIIAEIMRTGHVTRSRATLIARTETSRVASNLTEARATYVGSTHYIWRTLGDHDVRQDHKKLNGKVFRWDSPPIADERTKSRAHPGCIYNCRCYAEPLIPEDD